jgi:DsbC/DsbD-like thiol-disulfide interchange protein
MTKPQRILTAALGVAAVLPLFAAGTVEAQGGRPPRFAKLSAEVAPKAVAPGGKTTVNVVVELNPGFHIYANKPGAENLIPTVVTVNQAPGLTFGAPVYPAATSESVAGMPQPVKVYGGKAVIKVPVTVAKTAKGSIPVSGTVRMQGCNESMCYPPGNFSFATTLTVGK